MLRFLKSFGVFVIACTLIACGSDDDGETDSDTPGETLCKRIDACPEPVLETSIAECGRNWDDSFRRLSDECEQCVQSLTCDDWSAILRSSTAADRICPACADPSADAGS